ncbi:MAG: Calx-beta domain-containing protein, partial [Desulfobulbia bacterium]
MASAGYRRSVFISYRNVVVDKSYFWYHIECVVKPLVVSLIRTSKKDIRMPFILKKPVLLLYLGFMAVGLENADAFLFRLDIGDTGQTVKTGWNEFTGDGNRNEPPKVYSVDGSSITVDLAVGSGVCGFRDYGGGDLGGDMVYPDSGTGPVGGRIFLTLTDLPAGEYTLTAYHNDTKSSHALQDPIDVQVGGEVSASTTDLGVVQTKCPDDSCLGSSTVTFTANGAGDVVITFIPTTDAGLVSKATLGGFELESLGNTNRIQFDTETSSGTETVGAAYIDVNLSNPDDVNTVTVDYAVTGGTADGNGVDYTMNPGTLTFAPQVTHQQIEIAVINDSVGENDETVEITLSNPVHAQLGSITQHTFTILPALPQFCPEGDLDGDCDVDYYDLKLFAAQWLDPPDPGSGYDHANLDGLGGVDFGDYARLAGNWKNKLFPVIISEFMAANDDTLEDPHEPNEFPDWIELYNASPLPVDLGGIYITDNLGNPTKWRIPEGLSIGAGEYMVLYADADPEQGPTHLDFKLSATGGEIGLFDTDGTTLLFRFEYGTQIADISYGRYPDSGEGWRYFATPTPGGENDGAYVGKVVDTKFSHDRGFYDASFNLSITSDTGGSQIHYTTDGSKPNEFVGGSTYLYTSPISISGTTVIRAAAYKPGYLESDIDTQSYVFIGDVVNQPAMDPGVVATYSSVIEDSFKSIPTLSIALSTSDLANLQAQDSRYPGTGLPKQELPTSVELIYPDPNEGDGFHINCGIEGHSWALSKRSFKLIFKSDFGPSQLRYPFFESAVHHSESAVAQFDRIVLRASKNMPVTYAGDQWTRDSLVAMNGLSARGTYLHLYLNGQ